MDRPTLRRMFLSAFKAEGLDYRDGGCQVVHPDLTWSVSLVLDGTGMKAPYRLVLGASVSQLGDLAPRNAEDCYLFWPVAYESSDAASPATLRMPDAAFPAWSGTEYERAVAIAQCVASVVAYARQVDSLEELRRRYSVGEYDGAFIIAPLRVLLEAPS